MNQMFILLDAQQGANPGGGLGMMLPLILIMVVMYFLMMRPQKKKEKEERKFRENLKEGDRVVFSGGIYGKVRTVGNYTVEVEVSNGVVMEVEKGMIQPAPER